VDDDRKLTDDEVLSEKNMAAAEGHRRDNANSKSSHSRHVGLMSLTRYFAPVVTAPKPSDIAGLCHACAALDIDAVTHFLFTIKPVPVNVANHVGTTPLLAAIAAACAPLRPKSHLAMIKLLLDAGADANMGTSRPGTQPTSPLTAAVALSLVDVVRLLIKANANIDAPPPAASGVSSRKTHQTRGVGIGTGMAPIHVAVFADRQACLEILLQQGAEVNMTFMASQPVCPVPPMPTSPSSPTGSFRSKTMSGSGSGGMKPSVQFIKGVTALHLAHSSVKCAEILVRYGAAVDVRDSQGRTALHWAVGAGSLEVVRVLVGGGADGDAADDGE
jgi:ankyrin repeat protein